ncbi:hypothetical protein [Hyphomicrobium sp. CS1BSMeth3]|uniref:hypothetical protein n=1 Tax=Hyphomicrobium sp. CS1BSMeth3 TaxID=1892844 RepID=UPI000930180E|nr:hypothetical protein [Hyphomicrobium sp. CS1BSMeth3]
MAHAHDERQFTFLRLVLLAGIIVIAIFNGRGFSPAFDPLLYLLTPFLRGTPLGTQMGFFYTTSVLLSLMTFMFSGLPAALYERVLRRRSSSVVSLLIWLAVAALMAYPAYQAWQDMF